VITKQLGPGSDATANVAGKVATKISANVSASAQVAIMMCTYNRPSGLTRALNSLATMQLPSNTDVELLLVDNSKDANAKTLFDNTIDRLPFKSNYIHQPSPGISAARNAALDHALRHGFDFIATLDDDMHVDPAWLCEIFAVANETDADAIIGYRRYDYGGQTNWWIDQATELDRHAPQDRQSLEQGHTAGSLIRLESVRSAGIRFEQSLGLSGGEDTLFFDQVLRNNGQILYAGRAISYEVLGHDRMQIRWWLKRWYRNGNTSGLVILHAKQRPRWRVLIDGLIRIAAGVVGTVAHLPWLLRRQAVGLRAVRMIFRGSGYIAAAFGVKFDEYRQGGRSE